MLSPAAASTSLLRATDAAALKPVFEQQLSSVWGRPVTTSGLAVPRVLAPGGGRLLVQYRFSTAERTWIFWGQVGFESAGPRGPGDTFSVPELQLVVPVFPFDPELPELARFFEPTASAILIDGVRDALCLTAGARIEDVRVLGYRLGRRAVLRCTVRDAGRERAFVAKLLPPRKAARLAQLMRELAQRGLDGTGTGAIRVPRVLAESKGGILWLEERLEPSLHDLIGQPSFVPACRQAARALRQLHATPMPELPPWDVETELRRLRESVSFGAELRPDLAPGFREATIRLDAAAPGPPASVATLHRDFYDKQVLSGTHGTTLLDADTLATGDPAQDVGNFLAHLVLRSRQDPTSAGVLAEGREVFLAEYGELSEARSSFWEAASLVRLACVYALRPRWRTLAVALLEDSRNRLRSPGGAHV